MLKELVRERVQSEELWRQLGEMQGRETDQ